MKRSSLSLAGLTLLVGAGCASTGGAAADITDADRALQQAIGAKVKARVVWSSARVANHDLFVMNADGSDIKQITKGDTVDWFPRFSPDGGKILFSRSKKGWVYERDANSDGKWDVWTVSPDGEGETKVVDNASWANWISDDEIVYVRGTKVFRRKLAGGDETLMMDSEGVADLEGALLQQPQPSRDGRYLAITLRGSKRETGIWDLQKKTWTKTGLGCQINWTPDGSHVYWVNPTGNMGSEVFSMAMSDGKPAGKPSDEELKFMDLPGRRSHEYFPQLSTDGKWMVWAATQRGHDHDTADYEIYIWELGTPKENAARLTFHSGNDRWPDIHIPGTVAAAPEKAAQPADEVAPEPAAKPAKADKPAKTDKPAKASKPAKRAASKKGKRR